MLTGMPSLSHQEQQEAVDRIHALMLTGMSSGEAIALVAQEIRVRHQDDPQATVMLDDKDFAEHAESTYRRDDEKDADDYDDDYDYDYEG